MSNAVYEKITNQIIAAIEAGSPPWRKPWDSTLTLPRNAISNKSYTGVNVLTLWTTDYEDSRWLTFNQARDLNGTVKRGEKSTVISFYKTLERKADPDDEEVKRYGLLKYYHLFNVSKCEGLLLP